MGPKVGNLKIGGYLKISEFYWELVRKGYIIPFLFEDHNLNSKFNVSAYISEKGFSFLEQNNINYDDLILDKTERDSDQRQILWDENDTDVRNVIGYFK